MIFGGKSLKMHGMKQKSLFSYPKYWAHRFGIAQQLPMSAQEMTELGWDACDVIIVTGDAYIDHPSFGMALIGRLLEAQGYRVGIISQPNWQSVSAFQQLGRPTLCFAVTAGNMDSMVNHYTADKKIRSNDAYTPNDEAGKRPDRAATVYAQRCREAFKDVPVIIGGLEASLRRFAHYDYWADSVKRSLLLDSKADMLLYGNAERAIVDLMYRLSKRKSIDTIDDIPGTAFLRSTKPTNDYIELPSYEAVKDDVIAYATASDTIQQQQNPDTAKRLVQPHGKRYLWCNPPSQPLTTKELDAVYELPYSRKPHKRYNDKKLTAYEMIRFSINIMRGCFGGCAFCALSTHEGKIIQSRSEASILREIEMIRDKTPGFTGIISDLGGPTANMYCMNCQSPEKRNRCKRLSCLYPKICPNLNCSHTSLINLYRKARAIPGIKKILIGSGVRYDLANHSPEYIKELVTHHVGGYLKIAPEHVGKQTLAAMMKPDIQHYQEFKKQFDNYSKAANKKQYLIPYFIAAHPGSSDEEMLEVALWLKEHKYRLEQVQTFLPTPMSRATTMYYTEINPTTLKPVVVVKKGRIRRFHKALIRYHDPKNWPIIREGLKRMGREDLIGKGKLVPKASR